MFSFNINAAAASTTEFTSLITSGSFIFSNSLVTSCVNPAFTTATPLSPLNPDITFLITFSITCLAACSAACLSELSFVLVLLPFGLVLSVRSS